MGTWRESRMRGFWFGLIGYFVFVFVFCFFPEVLCCGNLFVKGEER